MPVPERRLFPDYFTAHHGWPKNLDGVPAQLRHDMGDNPFYGFILDVHKKARPRIKNIAVHGTTCTATIEFLWEPRHNGYVEVTAPPAR